MIGELHPNVLPQRIVGINRVHRKLVAVRRRVGTGLKIVEIVHHKDVAKLGAAAMITRQISQEMMKSVSLNLASLSTSTRSIVKLRTMIFVILSKLMVNSLV